MQENDLDNYGISIQQL
jgi:hypothetical protein